MSLAPTAMAFGFAKALDSQSKVIEGIARDAQTGVSAPSWFLRVVGWFGGDAATATKILDVATPVAKFAGRVAPVLGAAVAALDCYNCWKTWKDPAVSQVSKNRSAIVAGLSVVSAGAMIASAVFPPAAVIGVPLAIAAAGISTAIQHWDTIQKYGGEAFSAVKAFFSGW